MPASACAALILAAGFSTRMERGHKPLLPIPFPVSGARKKDPLSGMPPTSPEGEGSALALLARLYAEAGVRQSILVSGKRGSENIAVEAERLGLWHVCNPHVECGMFSSVCAGLAAMESCGFSRGHCFIHPADIPLVRPNTLLALLKEARGHPMDVLIPTFQGKEGHPPLLPAAHIPAVLAWQGENGLRGALERLPRRFVPVADKNILLDMDTDAQYAEVRARALRRHLLDPEEAEELLRIRGTAAKGLAHARAVSRVASGFAEACKDAGLYALDPSLAEAGGLLHDMCKGEKGHEQAAGRELRALGLPDMAALVEEHRDCPPADGGPITEKELIYLADKYVHGDRLVTLQERFGQKLRLFAHDPEACAGISGRLARAEATERRLARELGVAPLDLARLALEGLRDAPQDTGHSLKSAGSAHDEAENMPDEPESIG